MEKLKSIDEINKIVENLKKHGKKIVLANGCFDILHVGHIRYLREAKKLGDCLIVGVNSDESVKNIKDTNRPIISLEERIKILNEIEYIDYLIVISEDTADEIIRIIKPDIHAKGTDYTLNNVPEKDVVASYGGKVAIVGDPKSHSTKSIIEKILNVFT